jgi:hypothetical protein
VTLSVDHGVTATDCGCGLPTVATSFTSTSSEQSTSSGRSPPKRDSSDHLVLGPNTRAGSGPRSESANELRRDILDAQLVAGEFVQGAKEAASDPQVYIDAARWIPHLAVPIAMHDVADAIAHGRIEDAMWVLTRFIPVQGLNGLSRTNIIAGRGSGSYTIVFESGKTYHGKVMPERARRSAARIFREYGDAVRTIFWAAAANDREDFKDEDRRIEQDDGPNPDRNYNRRNSPGRAYRIQDQRCP